MHGAALPRGERGGEGYGRDGLVEGDVVQPGVGPVDEGLRLELLLRGGAGGGGGGRRLGLGLGPVVVACTVAGVGV